MGRCNDLSYLGNVGIIARDSIFTKRMFSFCSGARRSNGASYCALAARGSARQAEMAHLRRYSSRGAGARTKTSLRALPVAQALLIYCLRPAASLDLYVWGLG